MSASTLKLTNNAVGKLAADITDSQTTVSLVAGFGAKFPVIAAGQWSPGTLIDSSGNIEIVRVIGRDNDVLSVTRAQEGTVGREFLAGDRFELRLTAGTFTEELDRIDDDIALKAPLASPAFTDTPTAPTASEGTNNTQIANAAFVVTAIAKAISDLVNSSPSALDTLNELASALGDDANFATTMTNSLAGKLSLSGGTLSGAVNYAPQVEIASASTVNIGAAASNNVTITGTTAITAFDTIAAGAKRTLTFSGALTLTNNATSLILPGAANITTAAGDVAEFVSLGSGNWRCTIYTKSSGVALISVGYSGGRGQVFTASGTFTVPAGVTAIKVRGCGAGGGAGSGQCAGGTTSFGSYCTATGGANGTDKVGGTASGGDINISGGNGGGSTNFTGGACGAGNFTGLATGILGGSSGNSTIAASGFGNGRYGGGGGAYFEKYITGLTPGSSITVTVGYAGGGVYPGTAGIVIVEW